MAFVLRSAEEKDIRDLQILSSQFTMINLPNDIKALEKKIQRSQDSFAGNIKDKADGLYLFVVEDLETETVVGSSLIIPKHGTKDEPHYYFKISKKEHFSNDLGIGFVHQILKLEEETSGPTEIGGLLVDSEYRRVPEKIGKQISLVRFLYMAMEPDGFEDKLLCELSPPQMAQGKSEFWESMGRRFTGLPYKEADKLSHKHKEFIQTLFPKSEIYTCLLSSAARFVLGRVGEETRPAQHLLEKLGFKYLNEVDPFDGGPHFGALTQEVPLIKNAESASVSSETRADFKNIGLVGLKRDSKFAAIQTAYHLNGETIILPEASKEILKLKTGDRVFVTAII